MSEAAGTTGDEIVRRCSALGFAAAGVCPAAPSAHDQFFRRWLAEGRHGAMDWLARDPDTRIDPRRLLPDAKSIIMVGDLYTERGAGAGPESLPAGHGRVSRYARGEDYHVVIKRRLHALCDDLRARHPAEQFRACVDTAPIMEREHAARAGLGWIGKHTLLIHPSMGSYLLLGAVVTTLDIPAPRWQREQPDHCGTCTRCIDACPTGAITPYSVDASRCISYLTIERRGDIAPDLAGLIGDRLFGCDVCQEVCPHNSPRPGADRADRTPANPAYSPRVVSLPLAEVAEWTADDRARALRGAAMKRATLEMWRRNAEIVAANARSRGTVSGGLTDIAPARTARPPSAS